MRVAGAGAPVRAQRAVGDQVVRRGLGDDGLHDVARAHPLRRGEVDQAAVAGPAREPAGARVLAALAGGDQQLDPAAEMDGQLTKAVVQERYERLAALQDDISWSENKALVGTTVELLVAAGEGSKDARTGRMSGRARDGRLVHFTATAGGADGDVRPGDVVETVVTQAAPHHLVADGPLLSHRRTRAGDAHEAGTRPTTPGVLLGMPRIGAPA